LLGRLTRVLCLLTSKYRNLPGAPSPPQWKSDLQRACEAMKASAGPNSAPALAANEFGDALATFPHLPEAVLLDQLDGYGARNPALLKILGPPTPRFGHQREDWSRLLHQQMTKSDLDAMVGSIVGDQRKNLDELRDARASLEFFERMVSVMRENTDPEARSCSVCMEDDISLDKLAITPCAHAFCIDCLKATVGKYKSCSICRQPLTLKDIHPVSAEVAKPAAGVVQDAPLASSSSSGGGGASSSMSSSSSSAVLAPAPPPASAIVEERFRAYGTKLAAVVKKLQELRAADAEAKVILFVQFDELKRKVAAALAEFGITNASLQGNTNQRARVIRDWQNNATSSTFVLLLSLAQSASGANLTAASHVVFLHPMLAPSADQAIAYELQAIGRARRHGQRRDVVHVWRFVTAETLEQTLTQKHQSALWAKESAREDAFAAQAAAVADPAPAASRSAAAAAAPAGGPARAVKRPRPPPPQ